MAVMPRAALPPLRALCRLCRKPGAAGRTRCSRTGHCSSATRQGFPLAHVARASPRTHRPRRRSVSPLWGNRRPPALAGITPPFRSSPSSPSHSEHRRMTSPCQPAPRMASRPCGLSSRFLSTVHRHAALRHHLSSLPAPPTPSSAPNVLTPLPLALARQATPTVTPLVVPSNVQRERSTRAIGRAT